MRKETVILQTFANACLIIFCAMCLLPMVLTVAVSVTDGSTIQTYGYRLIPAVFSWDAYRYIFQDASTLISGYKNSIIIVVCGTLLNLFVTSMIAYPLARRDFRFRGIIAFFIFFTMIFSGGMVPFYILIVQYLHWKNSLLALIIPSIAAPFQIFLLRVFFQDIPPALVESAKIDGASDFRTYRSIILPLSKPALATLALMMTLGYWNEAIHAMLFIDKSNLFPIQLILKNITTFIQQVKSGAIDPSGLPVDPAEVPSDSIMYAMMVMTSLPVMFVFAFLQKYFVKGMTIGAVKG
ncbi:MAG: sugar transporter permease [Paenibacillaceae bacterium]|nr:sugar transporter permease [Paenibacillaceae bacterium]